MELDTRGIVQILQACAKGGVSYFKLDGLEVIFCKNSGTLPEVRQEIPGPPSPAVDYQQVAAEDKALYKIMQKEELLISDPLAYENHALGEDDNDDQD